jgi:hypothetical protein
MIIQLNYKKILLFLITLIIVFFTIKKEYSNNNWFIGGTINDIEVNNDTAYYVSKTEENYNEKYHRPSKEYAFNNNYSLSSFKNSNIKFNDAKSLVFAYYGILEEASNMEGYTGGCGTIGNSKEPYSYAYSLFNSDYKNKISKKQFEESFRGIGHISLLKVNPLNEKNGIKNYFIEIEVITGEPNCVKSKREISYFGYYYGIVSTIIENNEWKISEIKYYPEDFLCAPYHGWSYDAKAIVGIVYKENFGIIDEILKTENDNNILNIYAQKDNNNYRFDFIKLTNGYEVLVQENIMKNGSYSPIEIIGHTDWKYLKLA